MEGNGSTVNRFLAGSSRVYRPFAPPGAGV
jgi:hypothetical protein